MRYIKPFLYGEKVKTIPVSSIFSYGYENGYTAIYTNLRTRPFLATANQQEIAEEIAGCHNGW